MTSVVSVNVLVNGEPTTLPAETTVAALVASRATAARGVAVALNGEVVPRSAWDSTVLHADDTLELLLAVAGG